jgi:hypothetical protein
MMPDREALLLYANEIFPEADKELVTTLNDAELMIICRYGLRGHSFSWAMKRLPMVLDAAKKVSSTGIVTFEEAVALALELDANICPKVINAGEAIRECVKRRDEDDTHSR